MHVYLRYLILLVATAVAGCRLSGTESSLLPYEVIAQIPHDSTAYTQGLQLHDQRLWESTGLYGQSSVREVDRETGQIIRKMNLPDSVFGEGLTWLRGELWVLTWREQRVFVLDPDQGITNRTYTFVGEGWGLTTDGTHLIMSDGTSTLRFVQPDDFSEVRRLAVTHEGRPVNNLNELEYIRGRILANIYMTDRIAIIHPANGQVTHWLDVSELRRRLPRPNQAEVLNGIAFDEPSGHLLVTGKLWPSLFVLRAGAW